MSKRSYPREMPPMHDYTGQNRPGRSPCAVCRKRIEDKEKMTVVETQVSWFRGDDEVEFYHAECFPMRKVTA